MRAGRMPRTAEITRNGKAATIPVNGEVARNSIPGLERNPEAMYWYSRSVNLRLAETQRHWARKTSNSTPAKICGRPTLNSRMRSSMKGHLYHGRSYIQAQV